MRVALLSYNAQSGDAIGNQVAEKVAFFHDRGADVRVFVESDQRLHAGVRPYCVRLDSARPVRNDWDFLTSADLIVVEYGHTYSLLSLLALLGNGRGRILFDYHGVTPPELWGAHNREVLIHGQRQRGLVWCADAAIAHSRFTRDELLQATHFPAERTYTLSHPLSAELNSDRRPYRDLREVMGLGPVKLLLFVGRLAPNKRVPVLVEALAHLQCLSQPVHATVIGDTSDLYAEEVRRCRQRAAELGIAERVHFLGHVDAALLRDAYRSADVFVMPSRHEGFCIPVIEALAAGLPVVGARAGALPETIGNAGLTFLPDDAEDLARQVRRVLEDTGARQRTAAATLRVAVVCYRFGTDFVGGAETSLGTLAETLHAAGHSVEVFTTCTRTEDARANDHPEGTTIVCGIPVHRFALDPRDPNRYWAALQTATRNPADRAAQEELLRHAVHSSQLVQNLQGRIAAFDAVIAGPYGVGLTHAVARSFPEKTLVLPCFHDEPLAQVPMWAETYGMAGGILYHSAEEQDFTQTRLGLNHPRAVCCGAVTDTSAVGDQAHGRAIVGGNRPYIVYCGRYSAEKRLPELLECARNYCRRHFDRFVFVFMGAGNVEIPRAPWARDLGFVDDPTKRDVLAGAAALVQLSRNESLSLAALEAWVQGVPVLVDAGCTVLAGLISRGGGGRLAGNAAELFTLLDDLWQHPDSWRELGRLGRAYVRREYGSVKDFADGLVQAVRDAGRSLAECMRQRGYKRASQFGRAQWREQLNRIVEQVLDEPARPKNVQLEIVPHTATRTVNAGLSTALVSVRVKNTGTAPALAIGHGRCELHTHVLSRVGDIVQLPSRPVPLPEMVQPGQTLSTALPVPVPAEAGTYRIVFEARSADAREAVTERSWHVPLQRGLATTNGAREELLLIVANASENASAQCCAPILDSAHVALAAADGVRRLPVDYNDVTQGRFASWKLWLKRKLLGTFKRAYVDVLSRQQSEFNDHALSAMRELAECCATLDSTTSAQVAQEQLAKVLHELAESRQQCRALEGRVQQLEAALRHHDAVRSPSGSSCSSATLSRSASNAAGEE